MSKEKQEEIEPKYKGMEGTYHIAKNYIEVQCLCGNYVVFRGDSTLVNATFCTKCKRTILRSSIDKKPQEKS